MVLKTVTARKILATHAKRFLRLNIGLFLYALGIALTIRANIGYGPWDSFHAGLGKTFGISIGQASIIVGFIIIGATMFMGEKIGLGTILNIVLIGIFLDLILWSGVIPLLHNWLAGILLLVSGLFIISVAMVVYMGAAYGAGPRDGLMVALSKRIKLPIGVIRGMIELTVTIAGWRLGGMIGLGTLLSAMLLGVFVQLTFRMCKFDPKAIVHSSLSGLINPK